MTQKSVFHNEKEFPKGNISNDPYLLLNDNAGLEDKFEGLNELMPAGVTYHDPQGRIIDANEIAQNILGFPLEDLKGHKFTDPIFQTKNKNGQTFIPGQSPPEVAVETGQVVSDMVMGINPLLMNQMRWLLVTAIPMRQPDKDTFWQVVCQIRDVSSLAERINQQAIQSAFLQALWKLFEISEGDMPSEEIFYQKIMGFLTNLFEYPEITHARIQINDHILSTKRFTESEIFYTTYIQHQHEIIGRIELHYQVDRFDSDFLRNCASDRVLLGVVAKWIGLVSQIFDKNQEITSLKNQALTAYDRTLEAWSAALETQDKEASGHTNRVTELALVMAKEMGFEGDDLLNIQRGALLHDIGKLSIPDEIILKPGKLTDEEFQIVKKHPEFAKKWLSQIELLQPALQIPYYHHEKWDGTGYPQGLAGEDIPLVARMFAIVDVWDALISDRPFRKAMDKNEALDLIMSQSGKQFDPGIVEIFLRVISTEERIDTSHEIIIKAFGQTRVWVQNRLVTSKDWQVHAAQDLFFLFLAHPEGLTKEQVGLEMWPDVSPDDLDVRFKNTLYRLRQATGKDVILLDDKGYHFNKMLDYSYDVETLEARINSAKSEQEIDQQITHLIKAVQQYTGDYLPDVDEIWVINDREHYRLMYVGALQELAELNREKGDAEKALQFCLRAIDEDPVFEEAHRLAMHIHAEQGNRAEVIRQYQICHNAFMERFGLPPSDKTIHLYELLIQI